MIDEEALRRLFLNSLFLPKDTDPDTIRRSSPEWDSLKHIQLVLEIEKTFGLRLSLQELTEVSDYKDLVKILNRKRRD